MPGEVFAIVLCIFFGYFLLFMLYKWAAFRLAEQLQKKWAEEYEKAKAKQLEKWK